MIGFVNLNFSHFHTFSGSLIFWSIIGWNDWIGGLVILLKLSNFSKNILKIYIFE